MIYLKTRLHEVDIVIRDIQESDISQIVEYWHRNTPEFMESIGVDVKKIVTEEETAEVFRHSLPENRKDGDRVTLVVCSGDQVVGYTNLNFAGVKEAYAHVHVIDSKLRNKGFGAFLFKDVVKLFFNRFGLRSLKFQTSVSNARINSLVQRQGLEPVDKVYIADPDGMAKPGYFYIYDVPREPFVGTMSDDRSQANWVLNG